ncbi:MAG: hypothetical protein ACTHJ0_12725 [Flavipsychrobacter sp.]
MKTSALLTLSFLIFSIIGCTSYGPKKVFGNTDIYYTSSVTTSEVDALGDYFIKTGLDKNGQHKTTKLDKSGNTYEVSVVVKKGLELDQQYMDVLKKYAAYISHDVFNNAPLEIHVCDNHLKTLRVVLMER